MFDFFKKMFTKVGVEEVTRVDIECHGQPIALPRSAKKKIDAGFIRNAPVGSMFWTVPWAVGYDEDNKLWIHGGFPVRPHSGGTVQMSVSRTREGFEIVIPSKCLGSLRAFGDKTEFDLLPVTAFSEVN